MSDVNANGVTTKEVSLYDEDGLEYKDDNPIPVEVKVSVLQTVLNSILAAIVAVGATVGFILAYLQSIDVVNYEGDKSIKVVQGYQPTFTVTFSANNQSGTAGYMLIDLSDATNWPHTNTGHIILKYVSVDTNTDAAFVGDLLFGFLSNVDATNGDFHELAVMHGDRSANVGLGSFDYSAFGIGLESDEWFGPTIANSTIWQTDVNLLGPNGATSFPAGAGDFVAELVSTAGTVDISFTVIYTTSE